MVTSFFGGPELWMFEDSVEGRVKKQGKSGDILYGRLIVFRFSGEGAWYMYQSQGRLISEIHFNCQLSKLSLFVYKFFSN